MALTESEKQYLHNLQKKLSKPPSVVLAKNNRPESDLLAGFAADWQEAWPGAGVLVEDLAETEAPGLRLGDFWRFQAVPSGQKLEMLGEILLALDGQGAQLPAEQRQRWEGLTVAPELTMFIAPGCPFCPQMVRQLLPLTTTPPRAAISLIDAALFTELARAQEIKAVPTVIVNGVYRLTGAFQVADLLDLAEKTDPAQLPAPVLERMLVEGQAGLVGELMLGKMLIFPNFIPLLTHGEINVRLGALVALETVGETEAGLVAGILPQVWPAYEGSDLTVRGDIVYLMGEWGGLAWLEPLERALAAAGEADLREALEEALEKIRERAG